MDERHGRSPGGRVGPPIARGDVQSEFTSLLDLAVVRYGMDERMDPNWKLAEGVTFNDLKGASVAYCFVKNGTLIPRVGKLAVAIRDEEDLFLQICDSVDHASGSNGPVGTALFLELHPDEYSKIRPNPDQSVARFRIEELFAL